MANGNHGPPRAYMVREDRSSYVQSTDGSGGGRTGLPGEHICRVFTVSYRYLSELVGRFFSEARLLRGVSWLAPARATKSLEVQQAADVKRSGRSRNKP